MADKEKKPVLESHTFTEESVDEIHDATAADRKNAEKYTRGLVPETDDPSLPTLTFRAVFLGSLFNLVLATASAVFAFRTTPITVPNFVATLLSYPLGILMSKVLPRGILNPGPFSVKEHVIATIIASAGGGIPYGLDNVIVQFHPDLMGNKEVTFWNSLAWVMCSQLIGFGIAGMARRFLIRPAAMLWPSVLSKVALFVGFHEQEDESKSKYKMSRISFFWIVAGAMFVFQWIPSFFAPAVVIIPVVCYVASSKQWKFLGSAGPNNGVGIGALTLDWTNLAGTQMVSPYWATLNQLAGNVIWWWIVIPIFYYSNAFGADSKLSIPNPSADPDAYNFNGTINTPKLFSSATFHPITAVSLMDKTTYDLNQTAYNIHAPIRITSGFAVVYGVSFMALIATITHVVIWYGKTIWQQAKDAYAQLDSHGDDIHNELMKQYTDVPEWIYILFLAVMIAVTAVVCAFTPFHLPFYYILLAITLTVLFIIPIGAVTAIAGTSIGLNILSQFVIGFLAPGKTIWVMSFKSIGTNGIIQALLLLEDLKLGHYMHISPVKMVIAQIYGTVLGAVINTVVSFVMIDKFSSLIGVSEAWQYSSYKVFYSAAAIWGAIGPQRFFGIGSLYQGLLLFFAVGLILPLIPFYANKYYPSERWHLINFPVMAGVFSAGYNQNWILTTLIIATLSQWYAFKYQPEWWKKYNYIMSIGLDVGAGIVVLITGALEAAEITPPQWALTGDSEYYCKTASD